jgi:hypothetical protein
MPKFNTISQEEYTRKKNQAIDFQPIRKEIAMGDIDILTDELLKVNGHMVPMTNDAFRQFGKIVGLPVQFDKNFTDKFGTKARQKLVSRLKSATAAQGKHSVSLVLSPADKKIVGVNKDPKDIISNTAFMKTTEQLIDKYNLEVNDFTSNSDGSITINTSSPKNHWGIKGLNDEDFFGGVTFSNNPEDGFQISPFLHRLICANGMIGKSFQENLKVNSFDTRHMEQLFQQINHLAERGFRPEKFEDQVRQAISTPASLLEMEQAYNSIRDFSINDTKSLEEWIPLQTTRMKYHDFGTDTITMSKERKKNAKTGTSVWEVINGLTHFATHDNGIRVDESSRRNIQVLAGQLLAKPSYDMQNMVASPF